MDNPREEMESTPLRIHQTNNSWYGFFPAVKDRPVRWSSMPGIRAQDGTAGRDFGGFLVQSHLIMAWEAEAKRERNLLPSPQ